MRVYRAVFIFLFAIFLIGIRCSGEQLTIPKSVVWVFESMNYVGCYDAKTGDKISSIEDVGFFKVEKDTGYAWIPVVKYGLVRMNCMSEILASCHYSNYMESWDIDELQGIVWGIYYENVIKWDRVTGETILVTDKIDGVFISAVDNDNGCWVSSRNDLYKISNDGNIEFIIEGFNSIDKLEACDGDGSCWLYDWIDVKLYHYSADGLLLCEFKPEDEVRDLYVRKDGDFYVTRGTHGLILYDQNCRKKSEIDIPYNHIYHQNGIGMFDVNEYDGVIWASSFVGGEIFALTEDLSQEIMRIKLPRPIRSPLIEVGGSDKLKF